MLLRDLNERHVVIWGAGTEGRAAAKLVMTHTIASSVVIIVDSLRPDDPASIDGVEVIECSSARGVAALAAVDVVIKSPGVSPHHSGLLNTRILHPSLPVTGGTDLWFSEAAAAPSRPLTRTIAVTGSKGKSTTSSLIAHLLGVLVSDVVLAGNVGRAPLDVLAAGLADGDAFPVERWHVLELSSFQTAEVHHSPTVAVLTALFPEHLDWHLSVERYYADKINLFENGAGSIVVNADNPTIAKMVSHWGHPTTPGSVVPFGTADGLMVAATGDIVDGRTGQLVVSVVDIPLTGRHNAVNVCAAFSAVRAAGFDLELNHDKLLRALTTFAPLEHRLEPLGDLNGRLVIDDGLSTAPQAAIVALAAFNDRPIGILIGGHDRGLDYDALAAALAARSTSTFVATVPESGQRIGNLVREACAGVRNVAVTVEDFAEFDDAVLHLNNLVPVGGVILLSPAAPSFGRFRNYKERSEQFRVLLGF